MLLLAQLSLLLQCVHFLSASLLEGEAREEIELYKRDTTPPTREFTATVPVHRPLPSSLQRLYSGPEGTVTLRASTERLTSAFNSSFTLFSVSINVTDLKTLYQGAVKDITHNHDKDDLTDLYQYKTEDWCYEIAIVNLNLTFYTLWDITKQFLLQVNNNTDIGSTFVGNIINNTVPIADIMVYPAQPSESHEASFNTTIDVSADDKVLVKTILPTSSNTTREEFDGSIFDLFPNVTSPGEAGLRKTKTRGLEDVDINHIQHVVVAGTAYVLSMRVYRDIHGRLRATLVKYYIAAVRGALTVLSNYWAHVSRTNGNNGHAHLSGSDSLHSGLVRIGNLHTWFSAWITAPDPYVRGQHGKLSGEDWMRIADTITQGFRSVGDLEAIEYALEGEIYHTGDGGLMYPIGKWELAASAVVGDEL
ncbi:MAG: hypothetical protein LQ351_003481 [Letrouitia transgressa]|nr:MAG: hypothetical protein LQ351_003481 [Letrouitia transgressa]